jgi:cell division protein FtsZ
MSPPDSPRVPEMWRLGTGEERVRAAIVGCGGAGCNTLRHVTPAAGAERVAMNDAPHPSMAGIARRVLVPVGPLKAIASLEEKAIPTLATNEEKDLSNALADRDIVFALGGLGGEFGGWGLSVVGRVARILGDTSLAFATVPFTAEGMLRRQLAEAQFATLRKRADGVVAFGNDALLRSYPTLPLARAFGAMGAIMARPAAALPTVLSRTDLVPLKRFLARAKEWRFGMGGGAEKHRCFLAVEQAYGSPWFTGRHEDIRQAIVLMAQPPGATHEDELLREIRLRSPQADVAWAVLPEPTPEDRVTVQILAGLDPRTDSVPP